MPSSNPAPSRIALGLLRENASNEQIVIYRNRRADLIRWVRLRVLEHRSRVLAEAEFQELSELLLRARPAPHGVSTSGSGQAAMEADRTTFRLVVPAHDGEGGSGEIARETVFEDELDPETRRGLQRWLDASLWPASKASELPAGYVRARDYGSAMGLEPGEIAALDAFLEKNEIPVLTLGEDDPLTPATRFPRLVWPCATLSREHANAIARSAIRFENRFYSVELLSRESTDR